MTLIDEDEVMILYAHGLTVDEVAERTGCHAQTVRETLAELLVSERTAQQRRIENVDWVEVVEDYQGYELTVPELCHKHLINRRDLSAFLTGRPDIKRRTVQWRRGREKALYGIRLRTRPNPLFDDAVRDYEEGVVVRDIILGRGIRSESLYIELAIRGTTMRVR